MKIKYSYYLLRFPEDIASLCHKIQEEFNAIYIDLPFLLPIESNICKYNSSSIIKYDNNKYFVANEKLDVCFTSDKYLQGHYFGLVNITTGAPEYVLWTTFYDDKIESLIATFNGKSNIRRYTNPIRVSATLKCGGFDV